MGLSLASLLCCTRQFVCGACLPLLLSWFCWIIILHTIYRNIHLFTRPNGYAIPCTIYNSVCAKNHFILYCRVEYQSIPLVSVYTAKLAHWERMPFSAVLIKEIFVFFWKAFHWLLKYHRNAQSILKGGRGVSRRTILITWNLIMQKIFLLSSGLAGIQY